MPNVNGKRFPYTPEGKMRARQEQQRNLPDQTYNELARVGGKAHRRMVGAQATEGELSRVGGAAHRALGGARTPGELKRIRRLLGMNQHPTTAGTSRFGEFDI